MVKLAGLLLVAVVGFAGQIGTPVPGTYPPGSYPPGSYPPGNYPPGTGYPGGGTSIPSRHKKGKDSSENTIKAPTIEADGRTVKNDGKTLVVKVDDGRTLTMTLNSQTRWTRGEATILPSKVVPLSTVHVVCAEDDQAFLTAVNVNFLKDPPVETAGNARPGGGTAAEDDELTRPTILHPQDAPDRPILHRGKPSGAQSQSDSEDDEPAQTAKAEPVSKKAPKGDDGDFTISAGDDRPAAKGSGPGSELIERTRQWALTFTQGLPNFVCQQNTTRYMEQSRSDGWQAQDIVSAKVLYEDGREKYGDISVDGKRTSKTMMELGGQTSTGEFASMLASLFVPARNTEFKFFRSTTFHDGAAAIYDFKVQLLRSDWTITVGGQTLLPAYSGSVWVDKASGQVRRIEMQADNVPKDFPFDSIQSAIDYEEVSLGTAKFLLPVKAENLSCQRGSTICGKNTIEFRDYHKYSGESSVTFQ
jgi:hypothetical protein